MSAIAQESAVRVTVAADRSNAALIIPPGTNRAVLTLDLCMALLEQANVEVTDQVRQSVADLLAGGVPEGQSIEAVVARTTPPRHGVDGYVEWLVEAPAEGLDEDAKDSYYDVSAYVMVEPGQVIGKTHLPTDGRDGCDVTGKTLAARDGKECRFKFDETILCDDGGQLIAQEAGVLTRTDGSAFIRKVLEVPDYVDFSTGNIDFHGDVIVSKGVRDLFTVQATGNVEVAGLIEAATIIAGNDLVAKGGFAGRERGTARCGGDFKAKYIDNIHAEITRDLTVDREIINCELIVHGGVAAPHGAIIGGRVVVTGAMAVGMLGSGANVPTEIVVGTVPRLEPLYGRLQAFVEKLGHRRDEAVGRLEQLAKLTGSKRATDADTKRKAELASEISRTQRLIDKAGPALEKLHERIEAQRTIDVFIERKLFSGVVLVVGADRYQVNTDVKGPLRLCRDDTDTLIFQRPDGGGGLLVQIADVEVGERSLAA